MMITMSVIRRDFAKTLLPNEFAVLQEYAGDCEWTPKEGTNGVFLAYGNVGISSDKMIAVLKDNCRAQGINLEILSVQRSPFGTNCEAVQFRVTFMSKRELAIAARRGKIVIETPEEANGELVEGERFIIAKPANLDFQPKAKRLDHMKKFIGVTGFIRGDAGGMQKAWVMRLFDEGLIERDPADSFAFRATDGGRIWFDRHQDKIQ